MGFLSIGTCLFPQNSPVRVSDEDWFWKKSKYACHICCFSSLTPLGGKAASLGTLQSTSRGVAVTGDSSGRPQDQGHQDSWQPRGHAHEGYALPGGKQLAKRRDLGQVLQGLWRRGHSQAIQHLSAVTLSNQTPFSPMNKEISVAAPTCTYDAPGLPVRLWQTDWGSFWSCSTSFICVHVCWMQPSFMLQKITICRLCFDKYYMEQRSRNCTGSPRQVLYPSPVKMSPTRLSFKETHQL